MYRVLLRCVYAVSAGETVHSDTEQLSPMNELRTAMAAIKVVVQLPDAYAESSASYEFISFIACHAATSCRGSKRVRCCGPMKLFGKEQGLSGSQSSAPYLVVTLLFQQQIQCPCSVED